MATSQNVFKSHPVFPGNEENRLQCRTLMGGTCAMREARTLFLPMEPEEKEVDYNARLERTFLFNGFRRTVTNLRGRVFDRDVTVSGSDFAISIQENIDLNGKNLTLFARDLFTTGIVEGLFIILVDSPAVKFLDSRAEQSSVRPYMIQINPKDLFYWSFEAVNGRKVLSEIRFFESEMNPDTGKIEEFIKVWYRGCSWEKWSKFTIDGQSNWSLIDSGIVSQTTEIPIIVEFFGEKTNAFGSIPPLQDLADLNVEHWQSSSDQRHILHVARVPVLFTKMLSASGKDQKIVIGVNRHLRSDNPNADARYIEHSGRAVDAGRQDIQDIENRMSALGIELLSSQNSGSLTATGKAINKVSEESSLQIMAKTLQSALEQGFAIMSKWIGDEENRAVVDMNTTYDLIVADSSELDSLRADRERGDLSRESYWREMKRRGVYHSDFDSEVEIEKLRSEGP